MNDERLQNLRERLAETKAKVEQLESRPGAIRELLREAEVDGDVGGADGLEAEYASFVGVIEAAKFRAGVLEELATTAARDARQAEQQAQQSEILRRHYENQHRRTSFDPEARAASPVCLHVDALAARLQYSSQKLQDHVRAGRIKDPDRDFTDSEWFSAAMVNQAYSIVRAERVNDPREPPRPILA